MPEEIQPDDFTFKEYQRLAKWYSKYPKDSLCTYGALGLCSEAGEVADKIKKAMRDNHGIVSDLTKIGLKKELGDCLWYLAAIAGDFGWDLGDLAVENLLKLEDRRQRDKISGSGDDR
jgi:NTP pyrophosphatase (non-canonical NTP hydrolase)